MSRSLLPRFLSVLCLLATFAASLPAASPARATGPTAAGTWYVATTGSDLNDCATPATPCATINAAIGKAADGDTIKVAEGTYTGADIQVVMVDRSLTLSGGWSADFGAQAGLTTIDGELTRRGIVTTAGTLVHVNRFHIRRGYGVNQFPYYYRGAGIYSAGSLQIDDSIVSDGTSLGAAGIYMPESNPLTMTNTIVRNNVATLNDAGGIELAIGDTWIRNSAIIFNTAGGGAGISGGGAKLTIENSTISGNRSLDLKNGLPYGGGLTAFGPGAVNLANVTITDNWAAAAGGGVFLSTSSFQAKNSIIANNSSPVGPDCRTDQQYSPDVKITSGGYNLLKDNRDCVFQSAAGDQFGSDTKLLPIVPDLGFAALAADSPARDSGDPGGCRDHVNALLSVDQRGAARVGRCDIGAYEYRSPGPAVRLYPASDQPLSASILTYFGAPQVFVVDSAGSPADGGPVKFQAPDAGASGIFADTHTYSTTTMALNGLATASAFWANNILGSYVMTASMGSSTVILTMINRSPQLFVPLLSHNYCADFFDDFSQPAARWYQGEDDFLAAQIVGGEYRVITKISDVFWIAAPACPRENYTVEADMRWAAPSGNSYGLLFGLQPDWSQLYFLEVNPQFQGFRLFRYSDASGFSLVAGPTLIGSIINGGTAPNHLTVTRNGSQISVIINNFLISTWNDAASLGLTRAGVMVLSYDDEPVADARFDNFRVTSLNSGALAAGADDVGLPTLLPATPAGSARPLPADVDWPWPTLDQIMRSFETR